MKPTKEIDLLQNQIDKLKNKDFDLEAWKKYTIVLIARIFGDHSEKIRQVESIEYDYSSWSLRDTSGSSQYLETCKKLGKEVLNASIDELDAFGLPEIKTERSAFYDLIIASLEDDLKGSQLKEIKKILGSVKGKDKIRDKVIEKLKSYGTEVAPTVIASILSDPLVIKELSKS